MRNSPVHHRILLVAILFLLTMSCAGPKGAAGRVPNIVLILIDDMGWKGPSCFGNPYVKTPNFDRLANEGMKFNHAYTTPVCAPTRAELLSGKYSARFDITKAGPPQEHNWSPWIGAEMETQLPFEEYTLAEALRDAGYVTGHLGKWHVGVGHPGERSHSVRSPEDLATMDKEFGWDYSNAGDDDKYDKRVKDLTDKAIDFVEQHAAEPFFLYLAHTSVHTEIIVPQEYIQKYLDMGYPKAGPDQAEGVDTADYFAFTDYLDEHTGRLLDRIDSLELTNNTLVIFLSDNGGLTRVTRNDPLRRGKGMCYEGGIRVPMLVRWPGVVEPGSECDVPVHSVDLYPTLLQAGGGMKRSGQQLDGQSLLPLLSESGELTPRDLFWHMPNYICRQKGFFGVTPHSAVRSGDYKLVEFYNDYLEVDPEADYEQSRARYVAEGKVELFNLATDVSEKKNLAEEMPEKVTELRERLNDWRKETGAKLPRPNPNYDPSARFPGR